MHERTSKKLCKNLEIGIKKESMKTYVKLIIKNQKKLNRHDLFSALDGELNFKIEQIIFPISIVINFMGLTRKEKYCQRRIHVGNYTKLSSGNSGIQSKI